MAITTTHPDLSCGAIQHEVTPSDPPDGVMGLMMKNAFKAATVEEGTFDLTDRRIKQWKALFKATKLDGIAELAASLRHDPAKPLRKQLIVRLEMVSKRMPENGRAVFIIDPEKTMYPGSADAWRLVIRDLPDKIKFVFAQRPNDAIAESHPHGEFWQLDGRVTLLTDETQLEPLKPEAVSEFADAAANTGLDPNDLRRVFARYDGYPFALNAAVRLLRDGTPAGDLPIHPEPTAFAAELWRKLKDDHGPDAIRLVEALAVLEVASPPAVVRATAGLDAVTMKAVLAKAFVRGLIRDDTDGLRLYHALFQDHVRTELDEDTDHWNAYHKRAVAAMRERLKQQPPDTFAAARLWRHVEAVEGLEASIVCFTNECDALLRQRGELAASEADGRTLLNSLPRERQDGEWEAVLRGNLGIVMRIRGDLNGAEKMYRKALEIDEPLGRLEGMANQYGNLGIVMATRGDLDGAEKMFRKALKINEQLGSLVGMVNQYGNLGIVMEIRGDLDGAEKMYRKALDINKQLGRLEGMATQYGNLGNVMQTRGDLDGAEEMYRKALDIHEQLGSLEGMASDYGNLGIVMQTRGDLDGARRAWTKARDLFKQLGANHMAEKMQGWIDHL